MFATTPKTQSLLIVPFGTIRKEVLVFLQNELIRTFGFDVRIAREEPIPLNKDTGKAKRLKGKG